MTTPNPVQARVISRFPYLAEAGSTGAGGNSTAAGAAQALTDRAAVTGEAFHQRQVTDGFDAEALPPVTYDLNDDGWTGAAAEIHKAVAYVKLEAARSGRAVHGDLQSGVVEMEALAKKAESGTKRALILVKLNITAAATPNAAPPEMPSV